MALLLMQLAFKSKPIQPCSSVRRTQSSKETTLSQIGLVPMLNVSTSPLKINQLTTSLKRIRNRLKKTKLIRFTLWMQTRRRAKLRRRELRQLSETIVWTPTDRQKAFIRLTVGLFLYQKFLLQIIKQFWRVKHNSFMQ